MKAADEVFNKADFNMDILKSAVQSVIEDQKIKKEIADKYEKDQPDKWSLDLSFKTRKGALTLTTLIVLISAIFIFAHYVFYSKTKKIFK